MREIPHRLHSEKDNEPAYDSITALPNHEWLTQYMNAVMDDMRSGGTSSVTVFVTDLKKFSFVNNYYSHPTGTALIAAIGRQIRNALSLPADPKADDFTKSSTFAARLHKGGDEFVIVVRNLVNEVEAYRLGTRLFQGEPGQPDVPPHTIGNRLYQLADPPLMWFAITPAGAIFTNRPVDNPMTELVDKADLAVTEKKLHESKYVNVPVLFYQPGFGREQAERMHRASRMMLAVVTGTYTVEYMPKIDAVSGRLCGFEALGRYGRRNRSSSGDRQNIEADHALAEETGIESLVWDEMVAKALETLQRCNRRRGDQKLQMAINVSSRRVSDYYAAQPPAGVEPQPDIRLALSHWLERYPGLRPEQIVIELTERHPIDNGTLSVLLNWTRAGFQLAIDDYGTVPPIEIGKLAEIAREIKIDKQLVQGEFSAFATLLDWVIPMFHQAWRLRVVAEGIETPQHAKDMRKLGVDGLQGYGFGEPMSQKALLNVVDGDRNWLDLLQD